jgi:hypothetical protein
VQTIIDSLPQIGIFLFVVFLGITICRKLSKTEFSEIKNSFEGIIGAAMRELTFRGGRAAKCNTILSVIFALVIVLVVMEETLSKLALILAGTPEGSRGIFALVVLLLLFLLASMCFVFSMERFRNYTGGKQ